MKRAYFLVVFAVLFLVFSCKKDETDPFKVDYTDESAEVSKANVEDNAIELVGKLDDLSQATAIEVLMHLTELDQPVMLKSTTAGNLLQPVLLMESIKRETAVSDISVLLKSTTKLVEDPISFMQVWDSLVGKYTYNFISQKFVKTELADKVVLEFPGKEGDTKNTAVLTIDNFDVFELTDAPIIDWPEGLETALPKSLNIELAYKTITVASFEYSGSFKSDGMPIKMTAKLGIDEFSFVAEVIHSPYSEASTRETFKYQDKILVETYLKAQGNWSEDNIEVSEGPEDVINSANAHFIFMNIKVVGKVNIKALVDKMNGIEDQYDDGDLTESKYYDALVSAINENAKLIVVYLDQNKKIAEAEAYKYYDNYYDEYNIDMRFVYHDGSKVDMETYMGEELNNLYDEINTFIADLNSNYGLELEPLNPPAK